VTIASTLQAVSFPDAEAQRRYAALVGIDAPKEELLAALRVALKPDGLKKWAASQDGVERLVSLVLERPQLFLLAGDVGTGKTELAQTIGDAVARADRSSVTLFSLSLAARGTGFVGEMTQRIVAAFDEVRQWGEKRTSARSGPASAAGIFFIDEADAIAQSRELAQMHHEDRAGVNALIRGIDDLARARIPVAIIMATNRLDAIDPAVLRRAALVFDFPRPNDEQRRALFCKLLPRADEKQIGALVHATGPSATRAFGFTYSDIIQRMLPRAVLSAYAAGVPLDASRTVNVALETDPTPPFRASS
jgi:SpoVK/Ycf46/Vps4 family AAA+-type ATPase